MQVIFAETLEATHDVRTTCMTGAAHRNRQGCHEYSPATQCSVAGLAGLAIAHCPGSLRGSAAVSSTRTDRMTACQCGIQQASAGSRPASTESPWPRLDPWTKVNPTPGPTIGQQDAATRRTYFEPTASIECMSRSYPAHNGHCPFHYAV